MKPSILLVLALAPLSAGAQVPVGPATAADHVVPTATLPPGPALPAAPAPAQNALAAPFSSSAITSSNLNVLATLLANLQATAEQLLPPLAGFNDTFDFATMETVAPTGLNPTAPASVFSSNFAPTLFTNFPPTLGTNLTAGTSVGPFGTSQAPAFALPSGFAASPQARDTLRALLVLQRDVEQMLPTLAALNGATNGVAGVGIPAGFTPAPFTNVFGGGARF